MSRILAAFLQQETNTFFRRASTLADFERCALLESDAIGRVFRGTRTDWGALIAASEARGWDLLYAVHAHAQPAGTLERMAFEQLASRIVDRWDADCDGALLMLHGSMVAEGVDDCEGELLRRLRERVGPDKPIVATLDPHANVTQAMADHASSLIAYRTTPHVDQAETTERAIGILDEALRGSRLYVMLAKPPTMVGLDAARTIAGHGPMVDLLARAAEVERDPDVLAVSLQAGFSFADVPDIGPSVALTVRSRQPRLADLAAGLAAEIWRRRDERTIAFLPVPDGLALAARPRRRAGPFVVVDVADNPGSGAPGDDTGLLAALLAEDPKDSVFFSIADPEAAGRCLEGGVGATVALDLGNRSNGRQPLRVVGRVEAVSEGTYRRRGPYFTDTNGNLGASALLRVGNVGIVVASAAVQTEERAQFALFGLEFEKLGTVACKAMNHFRADLEPLASGVAYVDTGGICSPDPATRAYSRVRRPIWPLDRDLFA
jgi:microcystin degradation protein MlrC